MRKTRKLLLGLLTSLPLLYILTVLFVFSDFRYETIEKIHYTVMVLYGCLLVVYVYNVRTNERVPDDKRALWYALVVIGSSVAQLAYFWSYIWPDELGR